MSSKLSRSTRRDVLLAGTTLLVMAPHVARGQGAEPVRFSLEFRIYGGNAPMFLAAENGIFRDLGLNVTSDGSAGSGESLTRVATGTHQFGLADASAVAEFAGRNPEAAPKIVMTIFDVFPAVIMSWKKKPVNSLKDLAGIKLGTSASDAGSKILPALLTLNNIDPNSFSRSNVDVKLRETMLMKGDVDANIAFDYTALFNLVDNGVKIEDINLLYFKDFGFNFPGNSLITSRETIEKNPDLVKRMALGCAKAWIATDRDRKAAIAAVAKRDRLLRSEVEEARIAWVLDRLVKTPAVKQNGIGYIDEQRLTDGLKVLADGLKFTNPVAVGDIYDGRFLPPAADRKFA
jgi:NitT/TauT family transport system substrate-binding protein